jgi:hypothetical protein
MVNSFFALVYWQTVFYLINMIRIQYSILKQISIVLCRSLNLKVSEMYMGNKKL